MSTAKKRLCTICARGGSKGVPRKNVMPLGGIPLIAHSIRQAKDSGLFDCVAVSSDDAEILEIAQAEGALIIERPDHMATDTSPKVPVIRHAHQEAARLTGQTFDTQVDLAVTAPLRLTDDIVKAVELQESTGASSVITGASSKCPPYFSLVELGANNCVVLSKKMDKPVTRRQDAPACFDMNGSIYVWPSRAILADDASVFYEDTRLLVMPEYRSVDVDTPLDFKILEVVYADGTYKEEQSFPAVAAQNQ